MLIKTLFSWSMTETIIHLGFCKDYRVWQNVVSGVK